MNAEATLSNEWGQHLIVLAVSAFHAGAYERPSRLFAMVYEGSLVPIKNES